MFRRLLTAAAATALACSGTARADEQVVKNDSLTDFGQANMCFCFAPGEEAAVWLTSPCNGNIVAIQIYWQSSVPGASQPSIEDAIVLYEAGNFPNPGPVIDEFLAPVMQDGGLNEFRDADSDLMIPISVPVMAGETFVVSLRFFNDNQGVSSEYGTIASDTGCQSGKNTVKVNGTTWLNACLLGVSGDWVIRAVIDCQDGSVGSCCNPNGGCDDGVTEGDCLASGGMWNGSGSLCATTTCVGACLGSNGSCVPGITKAQCDAFSGTWQGPGTDSCTTPCTADADGDGDADVDDINAFVSNFLDAINGNADIDNDGDEDVDDIAAFVDAFVDGCP